jgi:hypothetical protein
MNVKVTIFRNVSTDPIGTDCGCFDIRETNLGTNGLDHGARNFL